MCMEGEWKTKEDWGNKDQTYAPNEIVMKVFSYVVCSVFTGLDKKSNKVKTPEEVSALYGEHKILLYTFQVSMKK